MIEISVIVPAYNEAENIPQNLKRMIDALNITGREFEILPVDDGSTDETSSKIRIMAEDDRRVRYVGYKQNGGDDIF